MMKNNQVKKTFMLDKRLEKKLRYIYGQLITTDEKNWSLSKIINLLLLHSLITSSTPTDIEFIKSFLDGKNLNFDKKIMEDIIQKLTYNNLE